MADIQIASKEAQEILQSVIKQHFSDDDEAEHFVGKPVVALFRCTTPEDPWVQKGATVRGKFAKLNDVAKAVSDPSLWEVPVDAGLPAEVPPYAAVILNRTFYNGLNRNGKQALIHHELLFAFRVVDVQEFDDVLDEYGLWDDGLKDFGAKAVEKVKQLELALDEAGDDEEEDVAVTLTAGGKTAETTTGAMRKLADQGIATTPPN